MDDKQKYHHLHPEKSVAQMLQAAGFEHIRSRMTTPFTYVSVGRKKGGK